MSEIENVKRLLQEIKSKTEAQEELLSQIYHEIMKARAKLNIMDQKADPAVAERSSPQEKENMRKNAK